MELPDKFCGYGWIPSLLNIITGDKCLERIMTYKSHCGIDPVCFFCRGEEGKFSCVCLCVHSGQVCYTKVPIGVMCQDFNASIITFSSRVTATRNHYLLVQSMSLGCVKHGRIHHHHPGCYTFFLCSLRLFNVTVCGLY